MGIEQEEWKELTSAIDVVIHNGALVHWVYVPTTSSVVLQAKFI